MRQTLVDVPCTTNADDIDVTASHVNGQKFNLNIKPYRALIDRNGYIRFFILDWGKEGVHGYLLHPYQVTSAPSNPILKAMDWGIGFLGGYGLSRSRGALMKSLPQKMHVAGKETIQLGTFFLFSYAGDYLVKSFSDTFLSEKHVEFGYSNILTDELRWKHKLRLNSW
jgi:hypothetical protein